ncbi:M64 family metallopeptidase [Microbacterium sp. SS28]|uniref:M64 family metallopeptidase n=1 Tax=Microbacterium sp. SS28 TaxID=2919948 RepID=UPI001FAA0A67|nr:M64 family metallopeptidase [Microbacterium sp. SS28]
MGASDGAVLAFRTLQDNGPRQLRYNIAIVSDGYTAAEMPLFRSHCKSFLRTLFWTAPFSGLRCTFNVFALEVASTQSGIDDPLMCGDGTTGTGAMPRTYFDSTMCGGGAVRRVISLDSGAVRNRVAGFLPEVHSILVLVNSSLHGGVQGDVAVFTAEPGWEDTALHEFAHVLGLADEYACYVCDGTDSGRRYDSFLSFFQYGPLDEPNVTDQTALSRIPWGASILPTTTVPTPPGTVPLGTVGLFAGAKYYATGLFRSEESCKMQSTGMPFCGVCRTSITSALASWTPSTVCVTPTVIAPTMSLSAFPTRKVMITPGRGGYMVPLTASTAGLPGTPVWSSRVDTGSWMPMPANRTAIVPVNQQAWTHAYDHTVGVLAEVTVADLDFWVPGTAAFTTAAADVPIALPRPAPAGNVVVSDYADSGNVEGSNGSSSINIGGVKAGNGWVSIGTRRYYTRLAVKVQLDAGHFGPDDDPAWSLQSITWTPAPTQRVGAHAYYDITFDAAGMCWLNSSPATVVDPNVGFAISASGRDAIGQPFTASGRLVPTNVDYRQSISTIQVPRIPKWEWPMRLEILNAGLEVQVDGTPVVLEGDILRIGDVEIPVERAGG